jgi:rhodanese-related sulfurtransferase
MRNTMLFVLVLLGLLAAAGAVQGVAEADEMSEDGDMAYVDYMAKADEFLMSLPENNLLRMDMQELIDAVDAGDESIVIVDVRPASLYDAGHIEGSINVPFPELVPNMDMVPTDKKIAVVCTFDTNSAFSVSVMRIFGDRDAWVVVGGVPAWEEAGRELVPTEM